MLLFSLTDAVLSDPKVLKLSETLLLFGGKQNTGSNHREDLFLYF